MKKALLVGINYNGTQGELCGCYNDVKNMADMLKKKYNYDDIRILSEYNNDIVPTKKNILDNLKWLVSEQDKYNTLFFHYSGHGSSIQDTNNDEDDNRDEVLVPLDYSKSGIIKDDDLHLNVIKKIKDATKFYSVIDACHSGSMFDLKYSTEPFCLYKGNGKPLYNLKSWSSEFKIIKNDNYCDKSNVFTISGCRDSQTSADAWIKEERSFQGALTHHLIKTLEDFNFNIKYDDLMKQINIYMKTKDYSQRPIFSSGKYLNLDEQFTF